MSKLSEYSKFDHLDDDDDSSDQEESIAHHQQPPPPLGITRKSSTEGRYVFEHNGKKNYEWEQTLEEVNIYVDAPPNIDANQLDCQITSHHLRLGIMGHNQYFLDEDTHGKVDTTESSWYLDNDDRVINIILIKAHRGEMWESALKGREQSVDPVTKEEMKKRLMLERFQEENPGMDFRDAKFNGEVPDPRTFMGGVKYH